MSNWRDVFDDEKQGDDTLPGAWAEFQGRYLDLADFLLGSWASKQSSSCPPGSLSLWVEEGKLKVCLKIKAKAVVGFLVIHEPHRLLEELEEALHAGRVEWRKEGVRKRS